MRCGVADDRQWLRLVSEGQKMSKRVPKTLDTRRRDRARGKDHSRPLFATRFGSPTLLITA